MARWTPEHTVQGTTFRAELGRPYYPSRWRCRMLAFRMCPVTGAVMEEAGFECDWQDPEAENTPTRGLEWLSKRALDPYHERGIVRPDL